MAHLQEAESKVEQLAHGLVLMRDARTAGCNIIHYDTVLDNIHAVLDTAMNTTIIFLPSPSSDFILRTE